MPRQFPHQPNAFLRTFSQLFEPAPPTPPWFSTLVFRLIPWAVFEPWHFQQEGLSPHPTSPQLGEWVLSTCIRALTDMTPHFYSPVVCFFAVSSSSSSLANPLLLVASTGHKKRRFKERGKGRERKHKEGGRRQKENYKNKNRTQQTNVSLASNTFVQC